MAATKSAETSAGTVSKSIGFFNDAWAELKKVHSPTRQETIQATTVVLMMVVLLAAFMGLVDYLVGNIMRSVLT